MDQVQNFYNENKVMIVSLTHLVLVIPLIFLALRPEFIPSMIPKTGVTYAVYALLLVGALYHAANLVKDVKVRVESKKEVVVLDTTGLSGPSSEVIKPA